MEDKIYTSKQEEKKKCVEKNERRKNEAGSKSHVLLREDRYAIDTDEGFTKLDGSIEKRKFKNIKENKT